MRVLVILRWSKVRANGSGAQVSRCGDTRAAPVSRRDDEAARRIEAGERTASADAWSAEND